ncbi:MAG TPA: PilT/PilU family type 4a pilus ATPase, partial [Blastocatellia bacterium]|nr:PilT/PilU family type 4a pilus ATPase [Blastocatellia bacterium]
MPIEFNLLKTLSEHSRDVNSVALSRDDRRFVSGSGDRSVRLWDLATLQLLHTMEHGEWVNDVAFAPSGQAVVSAARNGSIKLWGAENGQLLGTIQAHPQNATCVTFSPDGSWIVSGGAEGVVRVFNLRGKTFEGSVNAHSGWIWRVAFASKGDRLMTAGADKVARIWQMGGAAKPIVLEGHTDEVLYAVFGPDDTVVATAGKDGKVKIWDPESGTVLRSIDAHEGAVNSVGFSPDGVCLVTTGADRTIKLWDTTTGELVREVLGGYDYMSEALFTRDGRRLISSSGDGAVKIWEVSREAAYSNQREADLDIIIEEGPQRGGGYSSPYSAGETLAETSLKAGLKVRLLQSGRDRHAIAVSDPPKSAATIAGSELTVLSNDAVPLLKMDLGNQSVTYDRTEGGAAPWGSEADPETVAVEAAVAAPVQSAQASMSAEFELSGDVRSTRYQAFEQFGEALARVKTESGRTIRLVRFDADTLYVLFDEQQFPTLILKADLMDVRDASRKAVFRLNLRTLQPIVARRGAGDNGSSENKPAETRDPLLMSGAEALNETMTSGPRVHRVLSKALWAKASDIHIPSGARTLMRVHGRLEPVDERQCEPAETEALLMEVLTDDQRKRFTETGDLDFSYEIPGVGRFRANICRQHRGVDGSFRVIPDVIPSVETLGLPPAVTPMTLLHQGLVLVTGPAGQGKTTTIAALVDRINEERALHVITVEDPIEFVYPFRRAVVNQREVGKHTLSFANALRAALREDPDVIVVGEMRDLETISLAVTAAETGHLVFGTLMTISAAQTVDRILDSFPAGQQAQIRTMLSESLKGIVSQQLVPMAGAKGRVLACEFLICNLAVANMIR